MGRGRHKSQDGLHGTSTLRHHHTQLDSLTLNDLIARASDNAQRIAELGAWPDYINPQESLVARIPTTEDLGVGFDAGIACCLDMIPRDKQQLAAILHAAYTPAAVQQVISESKAMASDSPSCWWLAACSVCQEQPLNEAAFREQLHSFQTLVQQPQARLKAAEDTLRAMRSSYTIRYGAPYCTVDGGMQGAYLDGHQLAVEYAERTGLYFIGTYQPTLGLDDFDWETETDEQGRSKSGPVHGSKQFVKANGLEELQKVLATIPRDLFTSLT